MLTAIKTELPVAKSPEAAGVSSEKLIEMLSELKKIDCHGFMVIRHGKIAARWFRYPYAADTPHAMYSVSKSITGIAIGFAVSEGLLSLDHKVADFFPEYVPKNYDENLKKVTLKHLITLSAGRNVSPFKSKVRHDWIKLFMDSKCDYAPGEGFSYINENFHMALAMLRKVTGVSAVEFLRPRLFEPLGIEVPYWETDHKGVEAGGWGLHLSPVDLAKIAMCFLYDSKYEGKQIIPKEWVNEAVKNTKVKKQTGYNFGYGCGVWIRESEDGPVRFDGMFGQVAEIHKKYDAVTVTVGGDMNARNRNIMFKYFPDAFIDPIPNAEPSEEYLKAVSEGDYIPPYSEYRSPIESKIDGRKIAFEKKLLLNMIDFPVSVIPAAVTYMSKDKAGNITDVSFNFKEDSLAFSWHEGGQDYSIECGLDGNWRVSKAVIGGAPYTAYSAAKWESENTLLVHIRPSESPCARNLKFTFNGNKVEMLPSSDPPSDAILDSLRGTVRDFLKSEKRADALLTWAKNTLKPVHKGRFKK